MEKYLKLARLILLVLLIFLFYLKTAEADIEKSVSDPNLEPGDVATITLKIPGQSVTIGNKVDIILVMDRTGSMGDHFGCDPENPLDCDNAHKIDAAKAALNAFVGGTNEEFDHLGFVAYNTSAQLRVYLRDMDLSGKNAMHTSINALSATSSTSIGSGLNVANKELLNLIEPLSSTRPDAKKYIILASDGQQNTCPSVHNLPVSTNCPDHEDLPSNILKTAVANDIKVFTVGIGWDVKGDYDYQCDICKEKAGDLNGNGIEDGEDHFMYIAQQTGGQYFFVKNSTEMENIYKKIQSIIDADFSIDVIDGINTEIVKTVVDRNGDSKVDKDDIGLASCGTGTEPLDISDSNVHAGIWGGQFVMVTIDSIGGNQALCVDFDIKIKDNSVPGTYSVDDKRQFYDPSCSSTIIYADAVYMHDPSQPTQCSWEEFPLTNVTIIPFDYSLSSHNVTVIQGQSVDNIITANLVSGKKEPVSFSVSPLAGTNFSFSPVSCSPDPDCDTTLAIDTSLATPIGASTITVTGNPLSKTTQFTLFVNLPPGLNINCEVNPSTALVREPVTWKAEASGGIPGYTFSWSGATTDPDCIPDSSNNNPNYVESCKYESAGLFSATAQVVDDVGQTASCSANVRIMMPVPIWREVIPL
jgi:hypothetical protein